MTGMKLLVVREACCSQDDQIGPLEATYELPAGATVQDLVQAVEKSRFLQFSSTHKTMVGRLGTTDVVQVWSSLFKRPQFLRAQDERLSEGSGPLFFRFVFESQTPQA